jgi:uncharacterized repeat protein (TIGR03806 family)
MKKFRSKILRRIILRRILPFPYAFAWLLIGFWLQSCQDADRISADRTRLAFEKLSGYNIYQGNPGDLIPTREYKPYELSSELFTDYAQKQRLIKLPPGTALTATGDGLLNFPEGSVIVKTFYYFNDKRTPAKGVRLIETRILQLVNGKWVAGTYVWNQAQTEATLLGTGLTQTVNWIDQAGNPNVIAYQIPGNLECRTCHNSDKKLVPIGPKVRNLNFDLIRDGHRVNQLTYLQEQGILGALDPTDFSRMPGYQDSSRTLAERGRAYLDINCAHCHSDQGFAARYRYRMAYETPLNASRIKEGKAAIEYMMQTGRMPKIGTSVRHKEGIELIKKYLDTL